MGERQTDHRYPRIALSGPIDQHTPQSRLRPGELLVAQNVIYRGSAGVQKRPGSGPYGGTGVVGGASVASGVRWYAALPAAIKQLVVQSADKLYTGNDGTGVFTQIGALTAGSTPAFFAGAYDPAKSGVAGNPAGDILVIACGSMAPQKWDGTNLVALSPTITQKFTGCKTWHQHVWMWGDQANPATLYATDLGNPESMTFVNTFGGYLVGSGDGDPAIQCCEYLGDTLYVFKATGVWAVTGFDFISGDYQFSVTQRPGVRGTTAPHSVAKIGNMLLYWGGDNFYLFDGWTSTPIGARIANELAVAANGNQAVIRATAGSFVVQGPYGSEVMDDVYLCAVDSGAGTADTILVLDKTETDASGIPRWSVWTGIGVGCFVPFVGSGDVSSLYIGTAAGHVVQFGQNASNDSGVAIDVVITTGIDDAGTPDLYKFLDEIWIEVETNHTAFTVTIGGEGTSQAQYGQTPMVGAASLLGTGLVGSFVLGTKNQVGYQALPVAFDPSLRARNFQFSVTESSDQSTYAAIGITYHVIEEGVKER